MAKYRTTGPDVHPGTVRRASKPGKLGDGKIGVYDAKLRLRGVVGPLATATTAARFHGQFGSTIRTVAGRKAWVAPTSGHNSAAQQQMAKLRASLRAARGSVRSRGK
jgi:hypothetical protein